MESQKVTVTIQVPSQKITLKLNVPELEVDDLVNSVVAQCEDYEQLSVGSADEDDYDEEDYIESFDDEEIYD